MAATFRIYKPGEDASMPDSQRELLQGTQADIDKRKASGEQFSYTKVSGADPDPAAAPSPPPPTGGGGGGGAAPPPAAAANPAMASLLGGEPPPDSGMDVATSGPMGLRPGLGTRNPPQYNYALASLGRGVY